MSHGYVAVEGPHDVAFVGRLLQLHGLERVRLLADLDPFWHCLVPRSYPHRDDLLKRVPVPTFFASDTRSVAVHVVEGDSGFANTIRDSLDTLYADPAPELTGLAVLLDADSRASTSDRFERLRKALDAARYPIAIRFPERPGEVSPERTRSGIFVLPDNASQGTLEGLLLECASVVYPTLHREARDYLEKAAAAPELTREDLRDLGKPAGKDKALVACIAALLRPGKASQVSLQDNRWLLPPLARIPRVAAVHDFLVELLELDDPPDASSHPV